MLASRAIVTNPAFRVMNIPRRAARSFAARVGPGLSDWMRWLLASREDTNHTYELTAVNEANMAATLAAVLGVTVEEVDALFEELRGDAALKAHIAEATRQSRRRQRADLQARYGRRMVWYAIIRHLRPTLVVETGVDKGLGSVVICAALLRNRAEGAAGRYVGTDINPQAGDLLSGPYAQVGRIVYDDSLRTLAGLEEEIGLFINDSDHSATYEAAEYDVVGPKMLPGGFMIGDNAHATTALADYARERRYPFVFIGEQPLRHWHPGSGAGIVRVAAGASALG